MCATTARWTERACCPEPPTSFAKGQHIGTGQCPGGRHNHQLRDLIVAGRATPPFLVSHEMPLDAAPEGHDHVDKRDTGWTTVLLRPIGA